MAIYTQKETMHIQTKKYIYKIEHEMLAKNKNETLI